MGSPPVRVKQKCAVKEASATVEEACQPIGEPTGVGCTGLTPA